MHSLDVVKEVQAQVKSANLELMQLTEQRAVNPQSVGDEAWWTAWHQAVERGGYMMPPGLRESFLSKTAWEDPRKRLCGHPDGLLDLTDEHGTPWLLAVCKEDSDCLRHGWKVVTQIWGTDDPRAVEQRESLWRIAMGWGRSGVSVMEALLQYGLPWPADWIDCAPRPPMGIPTRIWEQSRQAQIDLRTQACKDTLLDAIGSEHETPTSRMRL